MMTEDEWLTKDDPRAMLEFVRPRATARHLRYFAAACCREVWDLLQDDRLRAGIEVTEEYAAGVATKEALALAKHQVNLAEDELGLNNRANRILIAASRQAPTEQDWGTYYSLYRAARAVEAVGRVMQHPTRRPRLLVGPVLWTLDAVLQAQTAGRPACDTHERVLAAHATAMRCIFGNPFRPVSLNPSWRTESAVALARSAYDDRAFYRLPVLADALEDAGCADAAVLGHLRQAGGHVRGCWVVDAVLGLC